MSIADTFVTCADDGPTLLGASCGECGAVYYPARPACGACGALIEDTEVPIGRRATLQRCTVCHVAPSGVRAPYVLGFVRLSEGPELLACIEPPGEDHSRLAPGRGLELRAGKASFWYVASEVDDE